MTGNSEIDSTMNAEQTTSIGSCQATQSVSRVLRQRCTQSPLRIILLIVLILMIPAAATEPVSAWLETGSDNPLVLIVVTAIYAILLAIPFVPAVEIGLIIMVMFGKTGALCAYLATMIGLSLAWLVGRHLVEGRQALPERAQQIIARVQKRMPGLPAGIAPVFALAVLLNMPGNTAVGGGGGISMLYGAGRLLSWPAFAVTAGVATAIVPLLFLLGLVGAGQLLD